MIVDVLDETEELSEEQCELLENLLIFIGEKEQIQNHVELSLSIVDEKTIQSLNAEYRQKDAPTDVLSFAFQDHDDGLSNFSSEEFTMPAALGDIIICLEFARRQAREYGHSLERELGFLSVHGFLHLLGYTHDTETDEKLMFTKQRELLEAFGLKRESSDLGGKE